MSLARTTLKIEEDVLKAAKRKALEEDKTLQEIVNEAVRGYLGVKTVSRKVTIEELTAYPIKVKGAIKRAEIYGQYLDRKFPKVNKG